MENENYNSKKIQARTICSVLSKKHNAVICSYDATAVVLSNISDKQHSELCKKLKCSGIYNDKTKTGILTNFGNYK